MLKNSLFLLSLFITFRLFGQIDSVKNEKINTIDSIAIDLYTTKDFNSVKELHINCVELFNYKAFENLEKISYIRLTDSLGLFKNLEVLNVFCNKEINLILPDTLVKLEFLRELLLGFSLNDSLFSSRLILSKVVHLRIESIQISKYPKVLNQWESLTTVRFGYDKNNSKSIRIFLKGISENIYIKSVVVWIDADYENYSKKSKRKTKRDIRWARKLLKKKGIKLLTDLQSRNS